MQSRLPLVGECYRSADVGGSITCSTHVAMLISWGGKNIKQIYTHIDFVNTVNCFTVATLAKRSYYSKTGGSVFLFVEGA